MSEDNFRVLPKQFRRDGFDFYQVNREGDLAVYRKTKPGQLGLIESWEVVRIGRHEGRVFPGGKSIGPGETYPASEQWGVLAWTFTDRELAFAKIRQLQAS